MWDEALTQARILIVDDEVANVQLLERLLQRTGYANWQSTTDPRVVLQHYTALQPDLILLDLHLPDMPGEAVLRRLWSSPATADIPVAILSADARPALIERLRDEGVRGFLTKPLDVKELLHLVDGVATDRERATAH